MMRPTCELRFLNKKTELSPGWNGWIKTLQQKWVDEAEGRKFEWRDVPLLDEGKENG